MENWRQSPTKNHRTATPALAAILIALLLPCWIGCGDKLTPVTGTVRLDGKPVAAAGVALHPVHGGPMAVAATDAKGCYRLETGNKSGVMPGEYRVSVVKVEMTGFRANKNRLPLGPARGGIKEKMNDAARGGIKEKWIIPRKYADPSTSGLTASVKPGMTPVDLDLKSQP